MEEREKGIPSETSSGDAAAGKGVSRRQFLKAAGAAGAVVGLGGGLGGLLAGCGDEESSDTTASTAGSSSGSTSAGGQKGREIKIGFVAPLTGPLASFGEADQFCVDEWKAALGEGLDINGTVYPINFIVKDSQSNSGRAAEVAGDLINNDGIDLMVVASTPDTVNPVADQCEASGMPCISNDTPWQPYYFGRGATPEKGFQWTYHFLEDVIANFTDMWSQIETNKVVGAMFPNDPDGNAWGDEKTGLPPALAEKGYTLVDPGRFQQGSDDFSAQISKFKAEGCEIMTGVMIPPDFTTFWKQAQQQGFKPKIASVGKCLLFPASVEALGDIADGLTTEVWWTPTHPFKSSLTGQTAQELADAYTAKTNKQWTQPLLHYALFEVAADVLKRASSIDDKQAIVDAIKATKMDTIAGPVDWSTGPVPNVSKTPLVGGQWVKSGSPWPFDLKVVSNVIAPMAEFRSSTTSVSASKRGRHWGWSGRTAPARRPCST
jgi:branched-chain amino acid transport system substrate-binding protein